MGEQVIFKTTTFGGFEKKQVLGYIDEMSEKARKAQKSLDQKLEEMNNSNNELSKQISSFEEKITGLEDQLKSERDKIKELTGMIDNLNSEIEEQKKAVFEKETAIRREADLNRQLRLKAETFEYKSNKYDDTSKQLGEILIDAKRSAQVIINGAKSEAGDIKKITEDTVASITKEIGNFKTDVSELRSTISKAMNTIYSRLDELEGSMGDIEARCESFGNTVNTLTFTVDECNSDENNQDEAPKTTVNPTQKTYNSQNANQARRATTIRAKKNDWFSEALKNLIK